MGKKTGFFVWIAILAVCGCISKVRWVEREGGQPLAKHWVPTCPECDHVVNYRSLQCTNPECRVLLRWEDKTICSENPYGELAWAESRKGSGKSAAPISGKPAAPAEKSAPAAPSPAAGAETSPKAAPPLQSPAAEKKEAAPEESWDDYFLEKKDSPQGASEAESFEGDYAKGSPDAQVPEDTPVQPPPQGAPEVESFEGDYGKGSPDAQIPEDAPGEAPLPEDRGTAPDVEDFGDHGEDTPQATEPNPPIPGGGEPAASEAPSGGAGDYSPEDWFQE